jgi:hypothetical protein
MRGLGAAMLICGIAITVSAQTAVPVPKATGPLPVTETNFPMLAAHRVQAKVDLPKLGYVEEEFIVSGTANVYDWQDDGSIAVKKAQAPYTTRILIRRPATPVRFSGNVILEPFENTRSYDWSFLWATSHEYFTERGDAWVGVTQNPQAVDAIKKFNPARYASVSMANPNPDEICGPANTKSPSEAGLKFDMLSQVGALLKSANGPMAGFGVQHVYGTSHTGEIVTYMNAVHSSAKLADGKPVFDGYLIKGDQIPTAISRCDEVPPANDPRRMTRDVGVPVIRVVAQGDVVAAYPLRRPDSDAPADRFRWYEVAAAPHMDIRYYQHMPVTQDQTAAGVAAFPGVWPFAYQCDVPIGGLLELPVFQTSLNAAFYHLDQWVRKGLAPPKVDRMTVNNPGTPKAAVAMDAHGNGMGGVRSPYVDVPVATYITHTPGQAICRNLGYKLPFDWTKMESLYGSSKNYQAKVNQRVDQLVKEGWLLESDAKRVKAELIAPPPTIPRSGLNNN